MNKKRHPKYEGMKHAINEEEASIIRRIYKEFLGGASIHRIAQGLNKDKIPTKKNLPGGWATSTISRILQNEKYAGHWVGIKAKKVRDPTSGKTKKFDRTEKERMVSLLPQCKVCGGAIVQVCGKGGGSYGCYNTKRKTCTNKLTIRKKRIEGLLLDNLNDVFLTTESFKNVYDEELKLKRYQCEKVQAQLQNLLNLIKVGNFSKTVSEALADAENCSKKINGKMQGLEFQRTAGFKAPPREWIQFKLDRLHATLTQNGEAAALSLKNLLGRIELEPALGNCKVKTGKIIEVRSFYTQTS
jgi:hypothetical protein